MLNGFSVDSGCCSCDIVFFKVFFYKGVLCCFNYSIIVFKIVCFFINGLYYIIKFNYWYVLYV